MTILSKFAIIKTKGGENMAKKYSNLFCVKSIITIVLCIAFSALCFIYPDVYTDTMKTVIVSVITFYFTHQINKKEGENNGNGGN